MARSDGLQYEFIPPSVGGGIEWLRPLLFKAD